MKNWAGIFFVPFLKLFLKGKEGRVKVQEGREKGQEGRKNGQGGREGNKPKIKTVSGMIKNNSEGP